MNLPIGVYEIAENLWCVTSQGFASNTYVIKSKKSNNCIIIDPGLDKDSIDGLIKSKNLLPMQILCTHGHFDHLGSAHFFQQSYGAQVHLHQADIPLSKSSNFLMMACKIPGRITVPTIDVALGSGSLELDLGDDFSSVLYHFCPGHTPGSCAINYDNFLFTGDTLYAKAVGLVSLPGENVKQLGESIHNIFASFEATTHVLPGHGRGATLADIRENNIQLKTFLNQLDSPLLEIGKK